MIKRRIDRSVRTNATLAWLALAPSDLSTLAWFHNISKRHTLSILKHLIELDMVKVVNQPKFERSRKVYGLTKHGLSQLWFRWMLVQQDFSEVHGFYLTDQEIAVIQDQFERMDDAN